MSGTHLQSVANGKTTVEVPESQIIITRRDSPL